MSHTINIAAAYGLVTATARAIHEIDEPFEYFGDFVGGPPVVLKCGGTPRRQTLLHHFLRNYGEFLWEHTLHTLGPSEMIDELTHEFAIAGVKLPKWLTPEKIDDNEAKLDKLMKKVVEHEVRAAFQVLFQDKEFLYRFQTHIKDFIASGECPREEAVQTPEKKFLRCEYIPSWLKRGVFFRDQGICQSCGKDVSGLVNLQNKYHLDHLLPLNSGGTNDATNFQLLCEQCNLKKGGREYTAKNRIVPYWSIEGDDNA